jgi:hypothetical protein
VAVWWRRKVDREIGAYRIGSLSLTNDLGGLIGSLESTKSAEQ